MFLFDYDVRFELGNDVRVVVPVSFGADSLEGGDVVRAERLAWDVLEGGVKLSNVSLADLVEGFFVECDLVSVRGGY